MSIQSPARTTRRHDLDWLRILAVLLLVPFHAAIVFKLEPETISYIKDIQSDFLSAAAGFVHDWHMPLLFFIAGASTWFALGFRSAKAYRAERILRLLLPFLFGVLVLIPPMTYLHRIGKPCCPTFLQHYTRFFSDFSDITGLGGGFTPGHLWFILFLCLFSLAGLPLFSWLRRPDNRLARGLAILLSRRFTILLWFIPLAFAAAPDLMGAMNPIYYFTVFASGFLLMMDERIQMRIVKIMPFSLAAAIIGWAALNAAPFFRPPFSLAQDISQHFLYNFVRWMWVLAILGLGYKLLNFSGKALRYLNEAAYPFYILHLPVLTLFAWLIVRWDASIAVKYILIVVLSTLATFALYEALVKPFNLMRFLMGMKPRSTQSKPNPAVQPAEKI